MNCAKTFDKAVLQLAGLALGLALFLPSSLQAAAEQSFDVLQVGTTTYRNVTITTRNKNYIFLMHSTGMASVKVADLSPELRTKLGYEDPAAAHVKTNSPVVWARQTLSKLDAPKVQEVRAQLSGLLSQNESLSRLRTVPLTRNVLLLAGALLVAFYLLHCYCCLQICRKAGAEPGPLIWLPLLQILPLLKAAKMSPWWFLGLLVPVVNLIGQILWCFRITEARGKTLFVALLLIFPLTSPLAVLYLAFSPAPRSRKESGRVEIMTLEAA